MFYRDSKSLSEISRKTGYPRNTIKHWLKRPEATEPNYQHQHHETKIAPYAAQIIKAAHITTESRNRLNLAMTMQRRTRRQGLWDTANSFDLPAKLSSIHSRFGLMENLG